MRLYIENEVKKKYEMPEYEIEWFSIQNILTVSGSQDDYEEDDDDENYDENGRIF